MTKLYKHTTDDRAEYLTDTFITWRHGGKSGKEGRVTNETRLCIRLDGQPEVLRNKAEDDRAELLAALKAARPFVLSEFCNFATEQSRKALAEIDAAISEAEA